MYFLLATIISMQAQTPITLAACPSLRIAQTTIRQEHLEVFSAEIASKLERTAPAGSAVYIVGRFDVRDPIRGQFDLPGAYRFWCTGNTLHATSLTTKRESTFTPGSTVTYISDSVTELVRPKEAMPADLRLELRTGQAKFLKFLSQSARDSTVGARD